MMAYDSQFVLCVLHDGSPVREINGKATIPFGSEYKIRLKNKDPGLRAKARVWVDGRKASGLGDFILNPGETLDLERFLDASLTSGRRFQFVPLSDSRVNDPTDSDNGLIKVEFYREVSNFLDWQKTIVIDPVDPWIPSRPWTPRKGSGTGDGLPYTWQTTNCYNSNRSFTSSLASSKIAASPSSAGATVEGGHSGQSFAYGSDFSTDVFPVTLILRLKGVSVQRTPHEVCTPPQRERERFCGNCGKRRPRMRDKFCSRCGTSYAPFRHVR